ncbi:MAG: 5-(carboxyamino)imidazole ribonucleotide synthase [Gammaproteobacteria bacterium]|nr:5-(carboxyamino)imidazole ribonucleotide synthase [Gammaproteobacteria bacterium]
MSDSSSRSFAKANTRPIVGIVGAGQLGRMLALSGYPLGLRFVFLDKSKDAPGGQVGDIILGEFNDPVKLKELSEAVDIVTFDVENVSVDAVREGVSKPFRPSVDLLEKAQDRLDEKELFRSIDIPTAPFAAIDSLDDLDAAVDRIGLPAVLKTRRMGYDGKGQRVLRKPEDVRPAFEEIGDVPCILEGFVDYDREVSLIGARSVSGDTRFYPLSENTHFDGILSYSVAPYEDRNLQGLAERHMERLFEQFEYAGVLTIEFFEADGKLIANEMAPRVHNSGHWTIEAAVTSQFENHIRAILDLPLGDTAPTGHAAMINFIGTMPAVEPVLEIPGAHYHDYGKEPRPGRKLGHATLTSQSRAELMTRLKHLLELRDKD